jgi:hypothetical protein
MTGLQSPELLSNLYRDLRDRRLLPIVVVLVVGIAVVPMALSSKSTPTPAPPAPIASVAKKSNVPTTQVKVSNPGIRVYQRRLNGDSAKNPFTPVFTTAPSTASASSSASTATTSSSSSTVTSSAGSATGTTGTSSSPTTSVPSGGGSSQPQAENKYFFYRVKVKSGPVGGKMTVHDNVKAVTSLPDDQVPALAFLGVTTSNNFSARSAVFLVNSSVSLVSGTGTCTLTGSQCQLVTMKPGDHTDLTWSDGNTYRVTLVKFNLITRNKLPGAEDAGSAGGGSSPSGRDQAGWNGPGGQHFSF